MMTDEKIKTDLPLWATLLSISEVQGDAMAQNFIRTHSLPTTRDEFWKYTRLSKLKNMELQPTKAGVSPSQLPDRLADASGRLVFVNGYFSSQLSEILEVNGLSIKETALAFDYPEESADKAYFRMLNRALPTATLQLDFSGTTTCASLEILHVITHSGALVQPCLFVTLAHSSECRIYEHFHQIDAASATLINPLTVVMAEAKALCNWTHVEAPGQENYLIQNTYIHQKTGSHFVLNTLSFNASLIRNNLYVRSADPDTETRLNGITLSGNNSHTDHHTFMDHTAPQAVSYENYRCVMGGTATGVFNGKVMVRQDAQKINAFQNNRNLLLSPTSHVYTKPELEIYADDVKCSHGSTTGQLDKEALFYLRARGISHNTALRLLIDAFFGEILKEVPSEVQRMLLSARVRTELNHL
jgi:Fe-S cluster assembly protein SufD